MKEQIYAIAKKYKEFDYFYSREILDDILRLVEIADNDFALEYAINMLRSWGFNFEDFTKVRNIIMEVKKGAK